MTSKLKTGVANVAAPKQKRQPTEKKKAETVHTNSGFLFRFIDDNAPIAPRKTLTVSIGCLRNQIMTFSTALRESFILTA